VEPHPDQMPVNAEASEKLRDELMELASRNPLTRRITEVVIWDKPLPVDIRHNSKIFREKLAEQINGNNEI